MFDGLISDLDVTGMGLCVFFIQLLVVGLWDWEER